jgi:hypothetical protein
VFEGGLGPDDGGAVGHHRQEGEEQAEPQLSSTLDVGASTPRDRESNPYHGDADAEPLIGGHVLSETDPGEHPTDEGAQKMDEKREWGANAHDGEKAKGVRDDHAQKAREEQGSPVIASHVVEAWRQREAVGHELHCYEHDQCEGAFLEVGGHGAVPRDHRPEPRQRKCPETGGAEAREGADELFEVWHVPELSRLLKKSRGLRVEDSRLSDRRCSRGETSGELLRRGTRLIVPNGTVLF